MQSTPHIRPARFVRNDLLPIPMGNKSNIFGCYMCNISASPFVNAALLMNDLIRLFRCSWNMPISSPQFYAFFDNYANRIFGGL